MMIGDSDRERVERVADRLHSASIHLLRRVRRQDDESGVTAPHLSALSVLVFGGARTLGELAAAEQVTPPSMTRIVRNLEADGLVERETDAADRRIARVRATDKGRRILADARTRRITDLAARLAALPDTDLQTLERAAEIIEAALR
ncbi:MarR family winged helix-turn-helix transcriptional regulator [Longimicrobium sp.]|uniref:MarR family winged helix-turn-helix transcriptional regulator n=1 Tax=Longimicrobium sp. TaxID=2029185 RepID=UPI002D7FA03E|nr:MarR family transcriptional regulator [Longimicrobium sp.]